MQMRMRRRGGEVREGWAVPVEEGGLKCGTILWARWQTLAVRGIFYIFIVSLRIWDNLMLLAYVSDI